MEPSSKEGEIKIEFCIDFAYVFNFDQFRVLGEYNNTLQFFKYNLAVSHRKIAKSRLTGKMMDDCLQSIFN